MKYWKQQTNHTLRHTSYITTQLYDSFFPLLSFRLLPLTHPLRSNLLNHHHPSSTQSLFSTRHSRFLYFHQIKSTHSPTHSLSHNNHPDDNNKRHTDDMMKKMTTTKKQATITQTQAPTIIITAAADKSTNNKNRQQQSLSPQTHHLFDRKRWKNVFYYILCVCFFTPSHRLSSAVLLDDGQWILSGLRKKK